MWEHSGEHWDYVHERMMSLAAALLCWHIVNADEAVHAKTIVLQVVH